MQFVTREVLLITYPGCPSRIFFALCQSFMFADENVSKQITMKGFYVPAALSLMLLSLPIAAQSVATDTILLATFNDSISLDEVVIKAHKTPRANSRWSDLQPVDLVTVGGSNGDLYRALQTLPGAQLQGESGRLLVRGGSSNETQTYIDGMHVLNPYTTTGTDTPARGRYSTFMFSGVNLASGGQSQEYGEALSAVLPLETKDYSTVNKFFRLSEWVEAVHGLSIGPHCH